VRRRRYWVDKGVIIRTFRTYDRVRVGSFTVTPIHVDHSIPGAYGFKVETPEGVIAYTGDYRLHGGLERSLTSDFVESLTRDDISLLITEATRFEEASLETEAEVEGKLKLLLSSTRGAALALFSETDIDRLRSFINAATSEGWEILIPLRHFHIIYSLLSRDRRIRLGMSSDVVKPYVREKARMEGWEQMVIEEASKDGYEVVTIPGDLSSEASLRRKVLVGFTAVRREIMKLGLPSDSVAILSYSEPADEEGEIELEKLLNWLRYHGTPSYRIHCSGHIYMKDLKSIVESVGPDDIYIVHSEYPEALKKYLGYG
jgi:ribonuclease J